MTNRPLRILVVDDAADVADSLGLLLNLLGNQVRVVYEGFTALQVAASFQPDVVILDLGLPRMNGYEVAKRLREKAALRDLYIIAATGRDSDDERRRCLQAGFDHFLGKPINLTELQELLAARAARCEPTDGPTS